MGGVEGWSDFKFGAKEELHMVLKTHFIAALRGLQAKKSVIGYSS